MTAIHMTAALALLAALPAAAQAAPRDSGGAGDPDRQICKSKPVIGSRLKRIRECHTAQEWEDLQLQDQLMLSTKQYNGDVSVSPMEQYVPPGRQGQMPQ